MHDIFQRSHGLLGVFVENDANQEIKQSDYDRAFNELASFLYKKYREQKQEEQIQNTIDGSE